MSEGLDFSEAFAVGRALQTGWSAFKRFGLVLFVGGCLKSCSEGGGGNGGGGNFGQDDHERSRGALDLFGDDPARALWDGVQSELPFDPEQLLSGPAGELIGALGLATLMAIALAVVALVLLFRAWLLPGWLKLHEAILVEDRGDFATLFSGASHLVPMLLWSLLEGCILVGSALVASLPGVALLMLDAPIPGIVVLLLLLLPTIVYVSLGLAFGGHAVVFENRGAVDAFTRSWELADGRRVELFVFRFVMAVVRVVATVVGLCLFCVGALVTGPIGLAVGDVGFTEAFLLHTRPRAQTDAWASRRWT